MGVSNTQGFEVRQEHTFSAVSERYLRREGTSAEVINAGVSGFSTAEALVLLENEGINDKPDVVVLGFLHSLKMGWLKKRRNMYRESEFLIL